MRLAPLLLAVLPLGRDVFPERLCDHIPAARPEVRAWIALAAPELASVPVRELSEQAALEMIGRASASGWGNMEFFTNEAFRESCSFYFSREALRSVNEAFDLALVTPVQGTDERRRDFEMAALVAGRGRILLLYDRDGIVYTNERENRDFKLASRVEFSVPAPGVVQDVHGLWTKGPLIGWTRIRSIVRQGEETRVRAGPFTVHSAPRPILARKDARRSAR